jgi:xylulokinase
MALLGIDLGTSGVKAVLLDETGRLLASGTQEYPIDSPRPGWAQQDPADWWRATRAAVGQALAKAGRVEAIGLSGQMHGTVLLDRSHRPLAPAIIWADQRSRDEAREMLGQVGQQRMAQVAGTAPATGFLGPTLLWLQRHRPRLVNRAVTVLLPKDFLRLRLTGEVASEATDASATALFDIRYRRWSAEIVDLLGLRGDLLPPLLAPAQVAGRLLPAAGRDLGLPAGIPVVAGCADQVAQAIGNGLLDPGQNSLTLGSGGQWFVPLDRPAADPELRLHTFCHAPAGRWYLLGATLTAGLSLRWLRDLLSWSDEPDAFSRLSAEASRIAPGADGLLFLPYLAGERSPLMDPQARGCFVGLTLQHGRGHLARAIMEGVAFAMRQIRETMAPLGVPAVHALVASGNGLAGPVWRQIVADVLNLPLRLPGGRERTAAGAALLAGIGTGVYVSYVATREAVPAPQEATEPDPGQVPVYDERYELFCRLYPALRPTLHALGQG